MTINDILKLEGYYSVTVSDGDQVISAGYTGDLLSDVMGNAPDDSVLITIQAHKNTVAVATLAGIKLIVVCNGRTAPQDMIEAAKKESIAIIQTEKNQFTSTYEIASLLNK